MASSMCKCLHRLGLHQSLPRPAYGLGAGTAPTSTLAQCLLWIWEPIFHYILIKIISLRKLPIMFGFTNDKGGKPETNSLRTKKLGWLWARETKKRNSTAQTQRKMMGLRGHDACGPSGCVTRGRWHHGGSIKWDRKQSVQRGDRFTLLWQPSCKDWQSATRTTLIPFELVPHCLLLPIRPLLLKVLPPPNVTTLNSKPWWT